MSTAGINCIAIPTYVDLMPSEVCDERLRIDKPSPGSCRTADPHGQSFACLRVKPLYETPAHSQWVLAAFGDWPVGVTILDR